ncbi:endonuclease G, mitochondrial [Leptonychotes weddellii]|uniref:Endonuclease n=1 Tax=Leptonychotes weddellii TaxID=9713 RepID=A0A2U3Z058_LEPWE|nr:endonuclease G, mitochondrial [Leptonychotes weddellii]
MDTSRPLPGARLKRAKKGRRDVPSAPVLTHSVGVPQFFEASVSGSDGHPTVSRPYPASSPAVGPADRRGPFKSLAGRQPEVAVFPGRHGPPSTCSRAALPAMQALRASLTLYGLPGLAQLKSRESYVLCYDPRTRGALWVVEQLRPERLRGDGDRRSCDFREDDSVHAYHRATNADYRGSGFDRGHLAAAANHRWSQKAVEDTFYLSNVAPQVPHLNQNAWNNLEKYSRSLTRTYQNVYVCTGPLFLPRTEADGKSYVKYQVIGKNHVAVPTHFFKVLILEAAGGQIELRSYVMPNAPVDEVVPLERFLVPIESIERASGLLFVPNILARAGSLKAITAGST